MALPLDELKKEEQRLTVLLEEAADAPERLNAIRLLLKNGKAEKTAPKLVAVAPKPGAEERVLALFNGIPLSRQHVINTAVRAGVKRITASSAINRMIHRGLINRTQGGRGTTMYQRASAPAPGLATYEAPAAVATFAAAKVKPRPFGIRGPEWNQYVVLEGLKMVGRCGGGPLTRWCRDQGGVSIGGAFRAINELRAMGKISVEGKHPRRSYWLTTTN